MVNAYALTLGGLLLLGGRAGDLLGRRRMLVAGLLLFSAASLAGGLATSPAWLLAARAVQGAGGAIVAPAALALVATTFPEGPPRNRAMGVYAAMSGAGGAIGLLAGGLLVAYASWRWVLFVNVPIGIGVALAAVRVLPAAARLPGRFDLPGTITGTGGVAALVYGLSNAATSPDGASHWGDAKVVAAQDVWGYSALRTGVAFLPMTAAVLAASAAAARFVPRIGARPLLLAGTAASTGGLYWLSWVTEHGTYASGLLGPMLVTGAGFGLLIVPLSLVALARVAEADSGVASSLLNTGRQVGGSIGLAVLGTVAWTVVADDARAHAAAARTASWQAAYRHALAAGFDRAFLVAAGIALLILVVAIAAIRVRRADLSGG